jgi:peptidoglycan/LPS O-acetylase OafA/YrhL
MKNLETVIKRSNNNFDLIRILAALMVLFFHSFYLFKNSGHPIPGTTLLKDNSIGGLAVYVFFFLSGMFITSSFINSKKYTDFILLRVFRIWPALLVCVIFSVFIVGPAVSKYSLHDYYYSRGTWDYLVHNILLYHLRFTLPGVFENNFYPNAVNGSIWTLPVELLCYCMVFILGICGMFKSKTASILVNGVLFLIYAFNIDSIGNYLNTPFPFFIVGSICYLFRRYLIIDYKIAILLLVIYIIFYKSIFLFMALLYGVLVAGSSDFAKKIKLPGDYSYGIYVYAFVVQQIIAYYLPDISSYQSLLLTVPFTIGLASLSWHFVEYPLMRFAKRKVKKGQQESAVKLSV